MFKICGDLLFDLRDGSIIDYFGEDEEVYVGAVIATILCDCKVMRFGGFSFTDNSKVKLICIPSSVEILCDSCFRYCEHLSSVIFEGDCKLCVIEHCVFGNCVSLTSICIPASVKTLGKSCFRDCISLSNFTIASGSEIETFGETLFRGCSSLSSICIPASVKEIGELFF
jgi:hypothetical protein